MLLIHSRFKHTLPIPCPTFIIWKWWQGWAQVITFIWSKRFWVQNDTEE
jgi:hypothetical protein